MSVARWSSDDEAPWSGRRAAQDARLEKAGEHEGGRMFRKIVTGVDTPLVHAVNEVGDGWMLLIMWASLNGVTRFDDFQRELGVARNILSERLRRLVDGGLMEKRPIAEGARRMEYRLTSKGESLEDSLRQLYDWGQRWCMPAQQNAALRAAE